MGMLVVSAMAVVVSRGLWVLALWLRLRAQARRDQARLRYLIAASLALPAERDLEETRPDGAHLHITRANIPPGGADHD